MVVFIIFLSNSTSSSTCRIHSFKRSYPQLTFLGTVAMSHNEVTTLRPCNVETKIPFHPQISFVVGMICKAGLSIFHQQFSFVCHTFPLFRNCEATLAIIVYSLYLRLSISSGRTISPLAWLALFTPLLFHSRWSAFFNYTQGREIANGNAWYWMERRNGGTDVVLVIGSDNRNGWVDEWKGNEWTREGWDSIWFGLGNFFFLCFQVSVSCWSGLVRVFWSISW